MKSHWGEFQSLIQISIALNAGYFSLLQFGDPVSSRERRLLSQTIKEAKRIRDENKMLDGPVAKRAVQAGLSLEATLNSLVQTDHVLIGILRYCATGLFLVGLVLLLFSSFHALKLIPLFWEIICALLSLPVAGGLFIVSIVNPIRYRKITAERRRIDETLETAQVKAEKETIATQSETTLTIPPQTEPTKEAAGR